MSYTRADELNYREQRARLRQRALVGPFPLTANEHAMALRVRYAQFFKMKAADFWVNPPNTEKSQKQVLSDIAKSRMTLDIDVQTSTQRNANKRRRKRK